MYKWFLEKRLRLLQYIEEKAPAQAPPDWWWVVVAAIGSLAQQTNIIITKLQAKDLIISQQIALLMELATSFCHEIQIEGPYNETHITEINKEYNSVYGSYSVAHDNVNLYLQDQGIAIQEALYNMGYDASHWVVNIIGIHMVRIVDSLFKIQVERNSANGSNECYTISPVLPNELVKLRPAMFSDILRKHLQQLSNSWSESQIDLLESQHRDLRFEYQQNSETFGKALDRFNSFTTFEVAWSIVDLRFNVLRDFCGGIATVFPNTATVEADFSNISLENDDSRTALTGLSLEGILQCKQWKLLESLV